MITGIKSKENPDGKITYVCGCSEDNLKYTYELCPKHEELANQEWFP
jgi:hypothetical protein